MRNHRFWKISLIAALTLVLWLPLITYVLKFGFFLSSSHQRWAEFGSFVSGVYSPVIAALALIVLSAQVRLQKQMNDHAEDSTFLERGRTELNLYLQELTRVLHSPDPRYSASCEQTLKMGFGANPTVPNVIDYSIFNREHPTLIALWSSINSVLTGFAASDEAFYSLEYSSSLNKISSLISFEVAYALDKYHQEISGNAEGLTYRYAGR